MNNLAFKPGYRQACSVCDQPYFVPLTYSFDGSYIYGQTKEGMTLMTDMATGDTHEHHIESEISDAGRIKPIVYRIKIKEKSGRFEKR